MFQVYEIGEEGKDSIRKKELPSLRSLTSRNIYFFFSKITLSTFQRAVKKGVVDRREKNRIAPKFLFEKILNRGKETKEYNIPFKSPHLLHA